MDLAKDKDRSRKGGRVKATNPRDLSSGLPADREARKREEQRTEEGSGERSEESSSMCFFVYPSQRLCWLDTDKISCSGCDSEQTAGTAPRGDISFLYK